MSVAGGQHPLLTQGQFLKANNCCVDLNEDVVGFMVGLSSPASKTVVYARTGLKTVQRTLDGRFMQSLLFSDTQFPNSKTGVVSHF